MESQATDTSTSSAGLLEREEERTRIEGALVALREGRGGLLLIEGEAGIGKSRLLDWTVDSARADGVALLEARGRELESGFSFGVARQLLERPLRTSDPGRRRKLLDGAAGLAAPLLLDGGDPPRVESDEFPLLHGLYWTVANLADERPLLLAVDDAHWADDPSLRFLAFLAPRLEELPILLVATTRPQGAENRSLAALMREPGAGVLTPRPLSSGAAADLAAASLGRGADVGFAAACREVTGGNPFLLGELLGELRNAGVAPVEAAAPRVRAIGPQGVHRVVLADVAALSPAATPLAQAIAILEEARVEDAAALARIESGAARRAADELAAAAILTTDQRLRFRHALVRNALYADIPAQARSELHRRAAVLLSRQEDGTEAAAAHLLRSAPGGEADAVELLTTAARASLARGGTEAAVDYLRRAVAERAPESPDGQTLWLLARAEGLAWDPAAAARYEEAIPLLADLDDRAEAMRELATVQALRGDAGGQARAVASLERSLTVLDGGDPRTKVALECDLICFARIGLGVDQTIAAHVGRMRGLADEGWEAGTPIGRRVAVRAAYDAALSCEPVKVVRALLDPALASGEFVDDEPVESAHFPVAVLTLIAIDDYAAAEELTEAGVASAQRRGSVVGFSQGSGYLALARLRRGAPIEAEADARAGLAVALIPRSTPFLVACLVDALTDQGRLAEAEETLAEHSMTEHRGGDHFALHLLEARGRLRCEAGDLERGLPDLLEAVRVQRSLDLDNPTVISSSSSAARALLSAGRREEAAALATEELERARRFGSPRALGVALAVSGLATGGEASIELLREAVETLAGSGAELQLARARIDLGGALRRSGSRSAAAEQLREGLEAADALGAAGPAERAREELTACGVRPRPAAGSGADSLTASELRVARMAEEGLSNPEIAQRLFVTRKTIEVHLSHTYRKLGISSRNQLGEALRKD